MAGRPPFLATGLNLLTRARVSEEQPPSFKTTKTKMSNAQSKMSKTNETPETGYRNYTLRDSATQKATAHFICAGKHLANSRKPAFWEAAEGFAAQMLAEHGARDWDEFVSEEIVSLAVFFATKQFKDYKDLALCVPYSGAEFSAEDFAGFVEMIITNAHFTSTPNGPRHTRVVLHPSVQDPKSGVFIFYLHKNKE